MKNFILKQKARFKRFKNIQAQKSKDYADGYSDCSAELINEMQALNIKIQNMTIQHITQLNYVKSQHEFTVKKMIQDNDNKCELCRANITREKSRTIKLQNDLKDSIQKFDKLIHKLFAISEMTHQSIDSVNRLATLAPQLDQVNTETKSFLTETKKLLEIDLK